MQVYCRGTARIKHRETGEIHEIESDELDWEIVDSDERGMGSRRRADASRTSRAAARVAASTIASASSRTLGSEIPTAGVPQASSAWR